ncbi:MAG: DotU family type IV/VI secretion system protein [bacterium]
MRLIDSFIEVIVYTAYMLRQGDKNQPSIDQVKADIQRFLSRSEECVKKHSLSMEDYDMARFAICAWIDEAILNSSWEGKGLWQKEQLQRIYYRTADAGEEFFERLNTIGLHQKEVREVYYLCLALGFTGRYCHEGDQYLLEQLKTSNLKLLTGSSVGLPTLDRMELFPAGYPAETAGTSPQQRKSRFALVTLIGLAGPAFLFGLLWIIYHFVLTGQGKHLLTMVP